jgi:hypothetical protein
MRTGRRVPLSIEATCGTVENVTAIERAHIRAYVPLSERGHRWGRFRDTEFAYDSTTDACHCPGDETLRTPRHPTAG